MSIITEEDEGLSADFRAMREASRKKREHNRTQSVAVLEKYGVEFESKNLGAHIIIKLTDGNRMDFWPGTGLWHSRTIPRIEGRGVFKLLKMIGIQL